jgi:hypothetical protein
VKKNKLKKPKNQKEKLNAFKGLKEWLRLLAKNNKKEK